MRSNSAGGRSVSLLVVYRRVRLTGAIVNLRIIAITIARRPAVPRDVGRRPADHPDSGSAKTY